MHTTQCRTVLLIAFHFPPLGGSSAVQRTLRFAQHLPRFGWRPIVLTIDPRVHPKASRDLGNEVSSELEVHRAFGFDTAKTFGILGRYPRSLAVPDRWSSWRRWAVREAIRIIDANPVDIIWSTFPIPTAHSIAHEVAALGELPWVAEFRDPMWQGDYPPDPRLNRAWRELEYKVFSRANAVVVTTPGAASLYASRFPWFQAGRISLIENGYDEETFARASLRREHTPPGVRAEPFLLLHSGLVYPNERNPADLFAAVATLKRSGKISREKLRIVLRASGNEGRYSAAISALNIADIVELAPAVDYLTALREMLTADGLLILQAANCNAQVPAKLYEYLRAGRPILALTDSSGDTARVLANVGTGRIAPLDSASAIEAALLTFIDEVKRDEWSRPSPEIVARYSRASQTGELARLFEQVVSNYAGVVQRAKTAQSLP